MGECPDQPPAPLVSFVVPVYAVETYLAACLDSLLAEADEDVEVVAVDDSSPDRCGDILDGYARRDDRVKVLHLPDNTGLGQARNAGLEAATGSYVWFVDGDDWLPPGSLPAVRQRLANRPDVLVVDHAEVHDNGRVDPSRPLGLLRGLDGPVRLTEHPQLLRSIQSACTKVIRRAFLDETKLRFARGWYEDNSFSYPLLVAAERLEVLNRVCYHYRQRERSITRTADARHFDVFEQYRRMFERVDLDPARADAFRAELFRLMIDHYLVIMGHETRVPQALRREFFQRIVAEYHARRPAGGYAPPTGTGRVKHALVRRGAYRTYAVLRQAYRPVRAVRTAARLFSGRRRLTAALPAAVPPR